MKAAVRWLWDSICVGAAVLTVFGAIVFLGPGLAIRYDHIKYGRDAVVSEYTGVLDGVRVRVVESRNDPEMYGWRWYRYKVEIGPLVTLNQSGLKLAGASDCIIGYDDNGDGSWDRVKVSGHRTRKLSALWSEQSEVYIAWFERAMKEVYSKEHLTRHTVKPGHEPQKTN